MRPFTKYLPNSWFEILAGPFDVVIFVTVHQGKKWNADDTDRVDERRFL